MNLSLTDEQELLREAARTALSRHRTIERAREALEDPSRLPDLWPTAVEAGWPGLLIADADGGAELEAFDAMLVAEECGRVLAPVPLLGVLPATAILDRSDHPATRAVAAGQLRPAWIPARPPSEDQPDWTVEPAAGMTRRPAPTARRSGDIATVSGTVSFVPDLPGAALLVVTAIDGDGQPLAVAIDSTTAGVTIQPVTRYDATRPLAHLTLDNASGTVVASGPDKPADAWYLAQSLIAADAVGAVQTCLDRSVQHAKERFTFGRAIGSYQSVKHELVEVLRRLENGRGLLYFAGWARQDSPDEFPLAASAARLAGGEALDFAARAMINVHGGIGATWEHDAPLFFRHAELSRRLLGGTRDAADRVADATLAAAAAS